MVGWDRLSAKYTLPGRDLSPLRWNISSPQAIHSENATHLRKENMISFNKLQNLALCALCSLSIAALPAIAAAGDGDGKSHHDTQRNGDGSWTQTDTNPDGSKTVTQMDKDHHKTKVTEFNAKGKVVVESDWEWNGIEKIDVKRKERHHAYDNILESKKEFDANGVPTKETVWYPVDELNLQNHDRMVVDTFKAGKLIKREVFLGGKLVQTQHVDDHGKPTTGK